MRTSKQARLEEWRVLRALGMNGRLLTWTGIKRWKKLRAEFEQTSLKPLKTVDNQ